MEADFLPTLRLSQVNQGIEYCLTMVNINEIYRSKVKGKLARVLREKPTVITRAVLWSIPHNSGETDISLKIGRYSRPDDPFDFTSTEEPETLRPKSELTLDKEEFANLLTFLQENYEPFKDGVKAYLPLDKPFSADTAEQVKALFAHQDKHQLVRFVLQNELIPEDIEAGIRHTKRARAIREFQEMLSEDRVEDDWQKWFEVNDWVLGSEYVRILDERTIDTEHIADFLMEAYDGFVDVIELKRPEGKLRFWSNSLDHGNLIPSQDLVKAITQATRYIYEVEREANSVKFLDRVDKVRTVKPRGVLIFGRSREWTNEHREAFRLLNSNYHNLTIMTYDQVLERAERILSAGVPTPDSW